MQQEELEKLAECVREHFARNRTLVLDECVHGPVVAAVVGRNHQLELSADKRHLSIGSDEPILYLDEVEMARRLHL